MINENLKKKQVQEPTKSELEILQVLWQFGPSTTRFVNDYLNQHTRPVIYMSTLKLMQIMVEKGLLTKDETSSKHIYSAAQEASKTKGILLDTIVDRIFNGSASDLVMQLLGGKKLTPEEKKIFEALIKKIDQE
ncbi:MAG TPA: BlaI/MecI/CopY family transcriptional regulator [Pedobacter sp.]|uniref:BlaI/MecI/CopY family transcriptional regulator n=1 Tax=Pedobacter sp. TaxID=1411316 RepID=UPI002C354401|nr:BlaI/MecI/CopY family transcriptional regulator [Pedobacter sp.]HMI05844.1 BlaI/MecI/CopY family transcriptional regulator [Pedobacter sp.]